MICEAPDHNLDEPSSYSIPAKDLHTPPNYPSNNKEINFQKETKRDSPHFGNESVPEHDHNTNIDIKEDKTRSETNQHEFNHTPTRQSANKGPVSRNIEIASLQKIEYREIKTFLNQANLSEQLLKSTRTDQPERQRIFNNNSVKSSAQKSMAVPKANENMVKQIYRPEFGSIGSLSFSRHHVNKRRSKLSQKKKRDIKEERKAQLELDPEAKKQAIAQNFKNIKNRMPDEHQFKAPTSKIAYGSNLIKNNKRSMMLLNNNKENNPTYSN